MAVVETRKLTKTFRKGAVGAVLDVDLESREGEFLVLLGPSGSGKTTLLRMIAGLETPTGGEILIGGAVVNDLTPRERRIAMVFQSYALYPHLSVFGNIVFPLKSQGVKKDERQKKADWAAGLLGIGHLMDRKPRELSGGERQRVAVARALVNRPTLVLADEPTGNLDRVTADGVFQLLLDLAKQRAMALVLVTHDETLAARCSRRLRLVQGKLAD
jgi:multiple sugar transport system ATP-binding protein